MALSRVLTCATRQRRAYHTNQGRERLAPLDNLIIVKRHHARSHVPCLLLDISSLSTIAKVYLTLRLVNGV